jgi:hypothetical protein
MMTAMTASLEEWPVELDSVVIAKRLRMYMGDKKLTRKELALASGIVLSVDEYGNISQC